MKKSLGNWLKEIWIERGKPEQFRVTSIIDIRTVEKSGYNCSPTFIVMVDDPEKVRVKLECFSLDFWVVLGSYSWKGITRALGSELKRRNLHHILKEE